MRTATNTRHKGNRSDRKAVVAVLFPACIFLIWCLLRQPIIGAAALYLTVFVWLAFAHPSVALMLTFASAPFQNDVSTAGSGARYSVAEVHLVLTFVCFAVKVALTKKRISYGPVGFPILMYLTICVISSILVWRDMDTIISFLQMFAYFVLAVILFANHVKDEQDYDLSFIGLVAVGVFFSLLGLALRSPYVLGIHKNGLGASLAAAFVVNVELWLASRNPIRRRVLGLAFVIITLGLINTLSRGAWLAAGTGLLVILAARREAKLMVHTAALMIPVVVLAWSALPEQRKQYVVDVGNLSNGSGGPRLQNARTAQKFWLESPLLGQGVGLRKQYDATNITLFTLAETGVVGLIAFLLIHIVVLRMVWLALRVIRPGDPAFSCVVIAGALIAGKLVHAQLDHYWSRGSILVTWASVGMATHITLSLRDRVRSQRQGLAARAAALPPAPLLPVPPTALPRRDP